MIPASGPTVPWLTTLLQGRSSNSPAASKAGLAIDANVAATGGKSKSAVIGARRFDRALSIGIILFDGDAVQPRDSVECGRMDT